MDTFLKEETISLRRKGYTYSEIIKELEGTVSKSTLSSWLKNLDLTNPQKFYLQKRIANKLKVSQDKALRINKVKRLKYLNNLKSKNIYLLKSLNKDIQKLLLSVLYLGEGSKTKSTEHLSLGSSNPNIILLYLSLLRTCFKLDNEKFRVRIQCRYDQEVERLEKYWSTVTGISQKQFYPTYKDKRSLGKPTLKKNYNGVCVVMYFDRSIQFELEFLADSVIEYLTKGR